MSFTKKINELVNENRAYAAFSFMVVLLSLVPLTMKETTSFLLTIEYATTAVFIFEYVARWLSAEVSLEKGKLSFLIYPFTPMALIDLLTILPTFILINQGFKVLRIIRLVFVCSDS